MHQRGVRKKVRESLRVVTAAAMRSMAEGRGAEVGRRQRTQTAMWLPKKIVSGKFNRTLS